MKTKSKLLSMLVGISITSTVIAQQNQNYVPKFTSSPPNTMNSLIYDNGSNIGIGITSPGYKLDVYGTANTYPAKVGSANGYLLFGPANTGFCHFATDRPSFYFNTSLMIGNGTISSYSSNNMYLQTNGTNRITVLNSNGYVGIGTSPSHPFHLVVNTSASGSVAAGMMIENTNPSCDAQLRLKSARNANATWSIGTGGGSVGATDNFYLWKETGNAGVKLVVQDNGNVGIGTTSANAKLTVNGSVLITDPLSLNPAPSLPIGYTLYVQTGILTEKVKVAISTSSNWSDYVFAKDYTLKSLNEVANYISENKHLPGIPSATEMVSEGLDVAKMDAKLLEKIEELTLYIIEQNKRIENLEKKNNTIGN